MKRYNQIPDILQFDVNFMLYVKIFPEIWSAFVHFIYSKVIILHLALSKNEGFRGDSDSNESACNAGKPGLIPELERSSGERNGNPFQYSCLENSMDRGSWQATVHGVTESDRIE